MRSIVRNGRVLACALTIVLLPCITAPVRAQELSRVSVDSVTAFDLFKGDGTTGRPDQSVDISSVIRIGGGWSAHVRPWFFKSSAQNAEWSHELYQAAIRYERIGPTSIRLDAGYIASPIGLGMLDMRADINPTIQSHMSYFVPLLPFDRGAPGVGPITASYPLGTNVTMSTTRWDVRAAVVNSAPVRRYAFNALRPNPDSTPVLITGGGITPRPGLRFGASFAAGRYATDQEITATDGAARRLTMWTAEAEYAFNYTKLSAEFTREAFRAVDRSHSSTWFIQAAQTLAPRWFAAGRYEAISAPPMATMAPGSPQLSFWNAEGSVGYRLTPEFTLRGSVSSVRSYTATKADRRVGAQIVWSRRWW